MICHIDYGISKLQYSRVIKKVLVNPPTHLDAFATLSNLSNSVTDILNSLKLFQLAIYSAETV